MATRVISGIAIVDANIADVTTQVELIGKDDQLDIVYAGDGKMMIVGSTKT